MPKNRDKQIACSANKEQIYKYVNKKLKIRHNLIAVKSDHKGIITGDYVKNELLAVLL